MGIREHGDFFHKISGGGGVGSKNQLLDGSRYPDSDFTEWKLVVLNVCISNFMTIPSSLNFLRPILVLAVKVQWTMLTLLNSWQPLPNSCPPYPISNIQIVHSQPTFKALYNF